MALRVNLFHRHVRDTILILEEGNLPHPRCPHCGIQLTWEALNGRHTTTAQCAKGAEMKRRRLGVEEMRDSMATAFQAYSRPLESVIYFKFLGRIMMDLDDD